MKRVLAAVVVVGCLAGSACADYSVSDRGEWPQTWPKELEPLRKLAKTYEGPLQPTQRYLIPFTKREEFEAAWPHLLKVKTKGTRLTIIRGRESDFFKVQPAGVMIQKEPDGLTSIELVVDGEIVDLNRIQLPPETEIVDQRFKKEVK